MENAYVHEVSDELTRKREAWRRRREQVSRAQRGQASMGSEDESLRVQAELKVRLESYVSITSHGTTHQFSSLQAEGVALNRQADQLNDLVRQIRKAQAWVTEREHKINSLEKLHINSDKMRGEVFIVSAVTGCVHNILHDRILRHGILYWRRAIRYTSSTHRENEKARIRVR